MCQELLNEEMVKQQNREQKRQKKKKKKNVKTGPDGDDETKDGSSDSEMHSSDCKCLQTSKNKENCKFDENINEKDAVCASCEEEHSPSRSVVESCRECPSPETLAQREMVPK
eukprot:GHVO01035114.1.p2 GENE.GHVO01035114.1~~GHVO01035114.1.p2  ORF type:complete len:113 (+),score=35.12 GHVO01035114.1:55-393(+)